MTKIQNFMKRTILGFAALMLINVPTAAVFAESTDECTPPASTQPGVHWPTGADSGSFTYQCDGANQGNWTNQYFVFDTATNQRTPRFAPDYSFNCSTDSWTMTWYYYSPAQSKYNPSRIAADTTPDLPTNCPVTAPAGSTPTGSTGSTGSGQSGTQGINGTGPGSSNNTNNNTTANGSTTNNNNLNLNNGINSQATTGNASIISNTAGGNASSGDAISVANIANMLQSTSNAFGPNTVMFTANINGDVNGDFMFDPSAQLSNTGPNSNNNANNSLTVNTNNTNNTDAQINNDIKVGAQSGDATVANNTNGGNATSGNAAAIVQLMNLINSTVTAGQSFIGDININGNLNGDILLPQSFIDQLIAASGPSSSNNANNSTNSNSTTTNTTNENIKNNVNSTATSGSANSSGNTTGGSATTGDADTNVTLLNLTGSSVVGKNNILVYVNVLGKWVGMIVNAPAGSTAASLGGGIISNTGPSSSNNTNNSVNSNDNTTNNTNLGINNNIDVSARSGNANVSGNTNGGNATSGSAHTAVDVVNLTNSQISAAGWFGILRINVLGNWFGSFGVNTSAGDPIVASTASNNEAAAAGTAAPMLSFMPSATVAGANNYDNIAAGTAIAAETGNASGSTQSGTVLAAATKKVASLPTTDTITSAQKTANKLIIPAVGALFALAILIAGERRSRVSRAVK